METEEYVRAAANADKLKAITMANRAQHFVELPDLGFEYIRNSKANQAILLRNVSKLIQLSLAQHGFIARLFAESSYSGLQLRMMKRMHETSVRGLGERILETRLEIEHEYMKAARDFKQMFDQSSLEKGIELGEFKFKAVSSSNVEEPPAKKAYYRNSSDVRQSPPDAGVNENINKPVNVATGVPESRSRTSGGCSQAACCSSAG